MPLQESDDSLQDRLGPLHEQCVSKQGEFNVFWVSQESFGKDNVRVGQKGVKFGISLEEKHRAGNLRQNLLRVPVFVCSGVHRHSENIRIGTHGAAGPLAEDGIGVPRQVRDSDGFLDAGQLQLDFSNAASESVPAARRVATDFSTAEITNDKCQPRRFSGDIIESPIITADKGHSAATVSATIPPSECPKMAGAAGTRLRTKLEMSAANWETR